MHKQKATADVFFFFPLTRAVNGRPGARTAAVQTSLYTVKAVIALDTEGKRVLAKYYGTDFVNVKDQFAFEKNLFDKTKRSPGALPFLARAPPTRQRASLTTDGGATDAKPPPRALATRSRRDRHV